jgi:hypothetical protein
MSLEKVLASAISTPRRLWGCPSADIIAGNEVNLLTLDGSPFVSMENLRSVRGVFRRMLHQVIDPSLRKETPYAA